MEPGHADAKNGARYPCSVVWFIRGSVAAVGLLVLGMFLRWVLSAPADPALDVDPSDVIRDADIQPDDRWLAQPFRGVLRVLSDRGDKTARLGNDWSASGTKPPPDETELPGSSIKPK